MSGQFGILVTDDGVVVGLNNEEAWNPLATLNLTSAAELMATDRGGEDYVIFTKTLLLGFPNPVQPSAIGYTLEKRRPPLRGAYIIMPQETAVDMGHLDGDDEDDDDAIRSDSDDSYDSSFIDDGSQ